MSSEKKSLGNKEEKFSSFILYAPKLKLKKPTISPKPGIEYEEKIKEKKEGKKKLIIFPN